MSHIKKYLFVAVAMLAIPAAAQKSVSAGEMPAHEKGSWVRQAAGYVEGIPSSRSHHASPVTPSLSSVMLRCFDAEVIAAEAVAAGWQAKAVTKNILTLRAPAPYINKLQQDPRVQTVQWSRKAHASMDNARADIGADRLHQGEEMETPFTGKGVVVGVIDQGFEYRHIAFLDEEGQSRVKWLWNRTGYSQGEDAEPTEKIPSSGDQLNTIGHATHVANIAAGSHIVENEYYGIAPDADIVMIPSEFVDAEVIEDVRFVADYAKSEHKPWVVNMSFGSQIGPHDGSDLLAQGLDEILSEGNGRAIVVAAGNDHSLPVHASHMFQECEDAEKRDTVHLLINTGSSGALANIWGQCIDSLKHLTVRPFLYSNSGDMDFKDEAFWTDYYEEAIDPNNHKECYLVGMPSYALNGGNRLGIELSGEPDVMFHAWTNTNYGSFAEVPSETFISGDNQNTVDALAACAQNTIVVASYNTREKYTNAQGIQRNENYGALDDITTFSNEGPLIDGRQKPHVSAPGSTILSAVSKYVPGFNRDGMDIVQDVQRGIRHFYYSAMSGTSMATPQVTGTIALWLQAYPRMTHEQLLAILQETSRKDEFTGDEAWSPRFGFGKIDAYEGLKAALLLAAADPVATAIQSIEGNLQFPSGTQGAVTISKQSGLWRMLFNLDMSWTDIQVTDLQGQTLYSQHIDRPFQGQEISLRWQDIIPSRGVFIVSIRTPQTHFSRKVLL